jgi:hypothetical protein
VTRELGDELLVYDLERHKAYCLNRMAMQVLRHCDGKTTVPDMAVRVGDTLGMRVGEEAIQLGLLRLGKAHLLEPGAADGFNSSRREMLRVLGRAAVVVMPVVTALSIPTAAHAASCACRCITGDDCIGCSPMQRCGRNCSNHCMNMGTGRGWKCGG